MVADIRTHRAPNQSWLQRWRQWLPLLLIWGLALLIRGILVQPERVVWGDEPFYLWLGRNWATGQGYQFVGHSDVHHGPLFPMLAGLIDRLVGSLEVASDIIYVLFGSLLVWPVYGMAREVYDRRIGLAAALMAAVWPGFSVAVLHWGTLTEPMYMTFVCAGLYYGLVALRGRWDCIGCRGQRLAAGAPWWTYGLAGLSIGLAYLTRPEAFIYAGIVGLALVVPNALLGQLKRATFWRDLTVFVAGFGLCFIPYAIYVHAQTGAWMVSEKVGVAYLTGIGLAHGDTAAFDRSTWGLDSTGLETFFFSSESYTISMVELILGDVELFLRILYLNSMRFARVLIDWTLMPALMLPLLILGLFDRGWSRERTLKEIYLALTWVPVLSFILFFIQARYLVPALPVAVIWVARGSLKLGDWLLGTLAEVRAPVTEEGASAAARPVAQPWRGVLEWLPVALVVLLLAAAYPRVHQAVTRVGSVRAEHRTMGEALRGLSEPGEVVMCRYPAIAFHAERDWMPTPNASWSDVLRYARHKSVDYFVIDQRELLYRPQFQPLMSAQDVPPELELVLDIASSDGSERMVIYRLDDGS